MTNPHALATTTNHTNRPVATTHGADYGKPLRGLFFCYNVSVTIQDCDAKFSKLIRQRDGWTCQRCGERFPEGARNLHCSHFFGRSNKATRLDLDNCDALCSFCHLIWEDDKEGAYKAFKRQQLGEEGFVALERRARSTIKFGEWE